MSKYVCELCKKDFKQKSDYNKHKNKKTPCITLDEIQKITITKEVKNNNKTNLTTIFKYCLDVLRDNEHLTGNKALRTLAHLLDLRLLEPQFGKTIDIGCGMSALAGMCGIDRPYFGGWTNYRLKNYNYGSADPMDFNESNGNVKYLN